VNHEPDHRLDFHRSARIGHAEAVYSEGKTLDHLAAIVTEAAARNESLLLTRLAEPQHRALRARVALAMDYDALSRTAIVGAPRAPQGADDAVLIVAAGTSDLPVAAEAQRTLAFHGVSASRIADVGVAGLHRLMPVLPRLERASVVLVCAGMDAALPSVIGGLVRAVVIAVPTSVGYGVAAGGTTALHACLASCASGITVVNIDNGFGAACAAMRVLSGAARLATP
jgi:hypothetical protein